MKKNPRIKAQLPLAIWKEKREKRKKEEKKNPKKQRKNYVAL